jgi:hypothetical protein
LLLSRLTRSASKGRIREKLNQHKRIQDQAENNFPFFKTNEPVLSPSPARLWFFGLNLAAGR